jgi:hypothetical protein
MTPNRDEADLIERLNLDAEMLSDGWQKNLTKLWHSDVVKDTAKDCTEAATALASSDTRITELLAADEQRARDISRLTVERDEARDRLATTQSELDEAREALRRCNWYWPEEDTSSETCAESAQEIVQNAYEWSSKAAGEVIPVARGGIVEVTYCASLPPADDADSDDDFWVQESSEAVAVAKIEAELARRAATRTAGGEE